MTDPITVRILVLDGEPLIDNQCRSLLLGVEVEALRGLPVEKGSSSVPREWVKLGRRHAREAQSHTGSNAMIDSLRFDTLEVAEAAIWAMRDELTGLA